MEKKQVILIGGGDAGMSALIGRLIELHKETIKIVHVESIDDLEKGKFDLSEADKPVEFIIKNQLLSEINYNFMIKSRKSDQQPWSKESKRKRN